MNDPLRREQKRLGLMTTGRGSERAAVFLRAIHELGQVSQRDFERLLRDPVNGAIDEDLIPREANARRVAFSRTAESLLELGVPLVHRDGSWSLRENNGPADMRHHLITGDQCRVSLQVESLMKLWDTTGQASFEPDLIAKAFVHRSVRLTYGGSYFVGIPYQLQTRGDRNVILLRTEDGDLGFYCDAISKYQPMRKSGGPVVDGKPTPPMKEADAVDRFEVERLRGRPTNASQVHLAQGILTVVAAHSSGRTRPMPWLDLEGHFQCSATEVEAMSEFIRRLDPRFEIGEEGAFIDTDHALSERLLDGFSAVSLRLSLAAFESLGTGMNEALGDLSPAFEDLVIELDEFLSRADLSTEPRPAPCGANVVRAIGAEPEHFRIEGGSDVTVISVEGLTWDGRHWWVLGRRDADELLPGDLELERIVEWVDH